MRTLCIALAVVSFGLAFLDWIQMSDADRQVRSATGFDVVPHAIQRQYFKSAANIEFGFGIVFIVITLVITDYETKLRGLLPVGSDGKMILEKKKMCVRCGAMHSLPNSLCLDCASHEKFRDPPEPPPSTEKPTPGIKVWG